MRFASIWVAGAALLASGCVVPQYEEYRERRYGVQRPVHVAPQDGQAPEVVYVPQGPTNFHIERYVPAPYYYDYYPGPVTYYQPQPYWYPTYGTPAPAYPGYVQRSGQKGVPPQGTGGVYYGSGYGGGYYGTAGQAGGGTKYYPGSGASTQPGESRESYGIYGSGNSR